MPTKRPESIAISEFKATCLAVLERVRRTGVPIVVTRRGQPIATLEAMKMELRIDAPAAGTVARVLVAPGDLVRRGQQIAEIGTR